MHELSIAVSILEAAEEERKRHGGNVSAIHLRLGPLAGVVKEALESAFEMAREQSSMPQAILNIEDVAIAMRCPTCDTEREVVSMQEMRCAVCGTPARQIIRGRELEIAALELT